MDAETRLALNAQSERTEKMARAFAQAQGDYRKSELLLQQQKAKEAMV